MPMCRDHWQVELFFYMPSDFISLSHLLQIGFTITTCFLRSSISRNSTFRTCLCFFEDFLTPPPIFTKSPSIIFSAIAASLVGLYTAHFTVVPFLDMEKNTWPPRTV